MCSAARSPPAPARASVRPPKACICSAARSGWPSSACAPTVPWPGKDWAICNCARITAWLDKSYDPKGARWQTNNSLYAIGSGGLFGTGLGNSKQKHLYVSEPQNDFIFAIVCEELGFIRAVGIILLYVLLVWRGVVIGLKAKDRFGAMLAMGIVFQVGLQTALNIGVVTDTLPNTGISLPFFSYGGTSLMMLLVEMGIVLAVSRSGDRKKRAKTDA